MLLAAAALECAHTRTRTRPLERANVVVYTTNTTNVRAPADADEPRRRRDVRIAFSVLVRQAPSKMNIYTYIG